MKATQANLPGIKKQVGRPRKYATEQEKKVAQKKNQQKYRDKKKYSEDPQVERSFMVNPFETERLLGKGKSNRSAKLQKIITSLAKYKLNAEIAINGSPRFNLEEEQEKLVAELHQFLFEN